MIEEIDLPPFARRLKVLRTAAKMTQRELAERAGMHLGGIFKLEQGVNQPSWDTVLALASALGVGVEAFAVAPQTDAAHRARGRPKKDGASQAAKGKGRKRT